MNYKKWIKTMFIGCFIVLLLVSSISFIIDPFQQYRKANFYDVYFDNERFLNPGLAKNWKYNSIITGSSMTENFFISDISKIMPNPIKLTISGATAKEINTILQIAFKSKNEIQFVLIGIDMDAISGDKDRLRSDGLPFFLYDDNLLNDIRYLYSIQTIKAIIKPLIRNKHSQHAPRFNYNTMYQWQHEQENTFGKERTIQSWKKEIKNNTDVKLLNQLYSFKNLKTSFDANFLSLIAENPNINFILFYPPYSVLRYKIWKENGTLQDILKFKKYLANEILKYPNTTIYDFQNEPSITTNLDLYRDMDHYHQKINTLIANEIKLKNYIVTPHNYDEKLFNFIEYVTKFQTK